MQPRELVEITAELLAEIRQSRRATEGLVHPEARDHDPGRPLLEQRLHVSFVTLRPQPVADLVARPCEAAEAQLLVRMRELHERLQLAVLGQALDHGVTVTEHGVVGLKDDLSPRGSEHEKAEENSGKLGEMNWDHGVTGEPTSESRSACSSRCRGAAVCLPRSADRAR